MQFAAERTKGSDVFQARLGRTAAPSAVHSNTHCRAVNSHMIQNEPWNAIGPSDTGECRLCGWRRQQGRYARGSSIRSIPIFCFEAPKKAIGKCGKPEIMDTDRGFQCTRLAWITTLTNAKINFSMYGSGHDLDNILIKMPWLSLKQKAVSLQQLPDGVQAKRVTDSPSRFFNSERPHIALGK